MEHAEAGLFAKPSKVCPFENVENVVHITALCGWNM